nr:MAG TPA_asm: hypothetical protein [Caudoviricetes sp.]
MPLFVHFVQPAEAPPVLAPWSKNNGLKIVHSCASLFIN